MITLNVLCNVLSTLLLTMSQVAFQKSRQLHCVSESEETVF